MNPEFLTPAPLLAAAAFIAWVGVFVQAFAKRDK